MTAPKTQVPASAMPVYQTFFDGITNSFISHLTISTQMMSINIHRHPFYRLRRHFWIFLFWVYYTTVQFGKKMAN